MTVRLDIKGSHGTTAEAAINAFVREFAGMAELLELRCGDR